jgi:2-polyprenyl-3-methyl-5-hydroxy-6-metoxy-1,4-benzoquinol methylase
MKITELSIIDQEWPQEGLEFVGKCPFCGASQRTQAYVDVQDWAFYCAPGKWQYWDCSQCRSLYLDPRPTPETIGMAYNVYYTHDISRYRNIYGNLRDRIRNELWYAWYKIDISPRLGASYFFKWLLYPFKRLLAEPFLQIQLNRLPKGKLLDVGCGSGLVLEHAQQLGWVAEGIEFDLAAVQAALDAGLNVTHGTFEKMRQFNQEFDCVVCSHVLEHVHNPLNLLQLLKGVLKPGGYLILVLPNASSSVRKDFGKYWRGIEAPRHLGMPSSEYLILLLSNMGFEAVLMNSQHQETRAASFKIAKKNRAYRNKVLIDLEGTDCAPDLIEQDFTISDFTKIVARKIVPSDLAGG